MQQTHLSAPRFGSSIGKRNDLGSLLSFLLVVSLCLPGASNGVVQAASVDIGSVTLVTGGSSTGYADGDTSTARFNVMNYCVLDPNDSKLIIADGTNNRLRKIAVSGDKATTTYWGTGTAGTTVGSSSVAEFNAPYGMSFNGDGTLLFIANRDSHTIAKITVSSGLLAIWAGTGSTGTTEGTGTSAELSFPRALYYHTSTNDIYVTEQLGRRVRKFTSAAVSSTVAGNPSFSTPQDGTGTSAYFSNPAGLDYDSTSNNALLDMNAHTVRLVTLAGVVTTGLSGTSGTTDGTGTAARLNGPWGIRIYNGYAYVTEAGGASIRRIQLSSFAVDTVFNAAHTTTLAVNSVSYLATSTALLAVCFGSGANMFFASSSAVLQVTVGSATTPAPSTASAPG